MLALALGVAGAAATSGCAPFSAVSSAARRTGVHGVRRGTLTSAHVRGEVGWRLWIPGRAPVATIFCLHGRGGSAATAFDELHLERVAAAATRSTPVAVASVDGGVDSYWHPRRDGSDAGTMLVQEFMPLIEGMTGTTRRTLFGWSMGGYGALLAAERHPEMFAALAALSPALWTSPGRSAAGAFDDAQDFRAHDVFAGTAALASTRVHLACGTSDPFAAATRAFAARLPAAELVMGPGGHTPSYWRSAAPAAMRALAGAVSLS